MSDTNGNDPKDRDLPGFSSHFSTTLTGLKPMRRRSRATTSTEVPPDRAPPVEEAARPVAEPDQAEPPEAAPMASLEEVRDDSEPPEPTAPEAGEEPDDPDDPLAGIELRPGLSLVDTAEIPIHRAQAAAKLARIREPEKPAPPPQKPAPAPPQRPVVRNRPPSQRPAPPSVLDDASTSARIRPRRKSSGGFGWLYIGVIILIACLIGALVMQVKDLL